MKKVKMLQQLRRTFSIFSFEIKPNFLQDMHITKHKFCLWCKLADMQKSLIIIIKVMACSHQKANLIIKEIKQFI